MIEPQPFRLNLQSHSEIVSRVCKVRPTYIVISRLAVARGWQQECRPELRKQGELE